ncbi:MAG: 1-acyl-sn-glycerol-3-phosphate acyltransferase [Opitutales bacterium]|nr:1-acyl-sn-glycerol-3-phosphate acyltransferase [Opitutales bacterium]
MRDNYNPKIAYSLVYYFARAFMETYGRLSVTGTENIPTNGGCLFAANHQSFLDPPLIGSCICQDMYFLARGTLSDNPILKLILPYCNVIPVNKSGNDIAAFKKMFKVLKENASILLFPEGTRSPDGKLLPAKGGAGLIACKTRVPVVPVRVFGAHEILPKGQHVLDRGDLQVVFEKPIFAEEYDPPENKTMDPKERFLFASRYIMSRIAAIERPSILGL